MTRCRHGISYSALCYKCVQDVFDAECRREREEEQQYMLDALYRPGLATAWAIKDMESVNALLDEMGIRHD